MMTFLLSLAPSLRTDENMPASASTSSTDDSQCCDVMSVGTLVSDLMVSFGLQEAPTAKTAWSVPQKVPLAEKKKKGWFGFGKK
jgi:hypothetical protein